MCGIAGFIDWRGFSHATGAQIHDMTGAISHRGPDDSGSWLDLEAGVALGHRRLAIIDLSPSGHQPMVSADGRWIIVFNGEIYNFQRIRTQLEVAGQAPAWVGHSDTEVLLAAIAAWGVDRALDATIGMFAFALWDRRDRRLILARDRAGEKPLYYGLCKGTILFGSELKSLRAHPKFDTTISASAVAAYMRFGYVPAPHCIYDKIRKVEPGTYAVFAAGVEAPSIVSYWEAPTSSPDPSLADDRVAVDALEELLGDAIGLQMRADVPMGAFLSGGVDSSAIVALMQKQASQPVRTFSIGFREANYNEAEHAAEVARHLGTQHYELYVTAQDALEVVPKLPSIYDEPFADSSQIPTYLLSKLTRSHVTVSLSGDAGDELFGGYARYFQVQKFERLWSFPPFLRRTVGRTLEALPIGLLENLSKAVPSGLGSLTPARIPKIGAALRCDDIYEVYRRLVSLWPNPHQVVPGLLEPPSLLDDATLRASIADKAAWMMAVDFRTYLPDDILVKVDRASMANSLETRVPFLDYRVVEFASRLPMNQKIAGGVGKRALRGVLYRHVPKALIDRPKQGFAVPITDWLRGPLRDWAEDLLLSSSLTEEGFFDRRTVRETWAAHLEGRENAEYRLWSLLMYLAWRRADERPT